MSDGYNVFSMYYNRRGGRKDIQIVGGFCNEIITNEIMYHGWILKKQLNNGNDITMNNT